MNSFFSVILSEARNLKILRSSESGGLPQNDNGENLRVFGAGYEHKAHFRIIHQSSEAIELLVFMEPKAMDYASGGNTGTLPIFLSFLFSNNLISWQGLQES